MSLCLPSTRKTNRTRILLTLTLISLLSLGIAPSSKALLDDEEQEEKTEQLQRLQQRIKKLRQKLELTRTEHNRARNQLRDIELKISHHTRELKYISSRLVQQDRRMHKLYRDNEKYQQDLKIQRQLLSRQLRTSYMMGQQAYLKLLLSQNNAAAAGRTLTYYDYFNHTRSQRIQKANRILAKVDQVKLDIEREKKRLIHLRQESQVKQAKLLGASQERSLIVARLSNELKGKSLSLNRMLDDEKQLQKLLQAISEVMPDIIASKTPQRAFAQLRGHLGWPVKGTIKQVFGKQRGDSRVRWNGVIIKAKSGHEIQAISHGRVAYADWLRGYGLLVIIDHGQGYMSLYGHNQTLFKETGDWVDSGEVIATVGNSGGQEHSGLYFEIRHKGKPANPNHWCRQRRS